MPIYYSSIYPKPKKSLHIIQEVKNHQIKELKNQESSMSSNLKIQQGVLLFSLLTLSISSTPLANENPQTVYEILTKYGLPPGLLPANVKSYSLSDDGSFVVELDKTCYIHFDYLVYYDKKITGNLKYGSITHLDGIQVKKLFLWLDVDEIKVDFPPSDSIYFQVGIINKKLDVGQFRTVHSCGDKLNALLHPRPFQV